MSSPKFTFIDKSGKLTGNVSQAVGIRGTSGFAIDVNEDGSLNVITEGATDISIVDKTTKTPVHVNEEGQLHVVAQSFLCTDNSTIELLLAGETFTGTAKNILDHNGLAVFVTSDVDGTLQIQYSRDGATRWNTAESYNISAGEDKWFTPPTFGVFFRVVYINGGADQADFEITTKLSKMPFKWSSHNIFSNLNDEDDSELVSAVLKLRTAQNNYTSGAATNSGNFKVSLEELESGVSTNNNEQLNVSPFILDEYGNYSHILGDNIFKGAIIAIPPEHHEIHCGDSYTIHDVNDLGNGATIDYLFITPNWGDPGSGDPDQAVKLAHMLFEVTGEAETTVYLYEAPTITSNGSALAVNNRNRNSANVDYVAAYSGATISAVGAQLDHFRFGAGRRTGGGQNRSDEWVLKNNTAYLIRIVNETTSNNYHTLKVQYYVHPGV